MSEFVLNGKAFAAARIMPKESSNKYGYMYVSPKGVVCTDGCRLIRITLPTTMNQIPANPAIFPAEQVLELRPKSPLETVHMPEGLPAKSNGQYSVPVYDNAIPAPEQMGQSIICDAKMLVDLLKAACDVTDHSRNLVRLSLAKNGGLIRIDAYREEGAQEFTAMLMSVRYEGNSLPGNPDKNAPQQTVEVVDPGKISLPLNEGRKFRE